MTESEPAAALAIRWREELLRRGYPADLPWDHPAVGEMCQAAAQCSDFSAAVQHLGARSSGVFTEDELCQDISAFIEVSYRAGYHPPARNCLFALALASYRQESAALRWAGAMQDPLTGLASLGSLAVRLWDAIARGDCPTLVLIKTATLSGLAQIPANIGLACALINCPHLSSAALLPAGGAIGFTAQPQDAEGIARYLLLTAPKLKVSSQQVPTSASLQGFTRWFTHILNC